MNHSSPPRPGAQVSCLQSRFILASNSPRRRELFGLLGLPFEVIVAEVDESTVVGESPAAMVRRLSRVKARAAAGRAQDPAWVIGADTTVALDRQILSKPIDADDARRMLRRLRGRAHEVYTGVALVDTVIGLAIDWATVSLVWMRPYSEAEIEAYIATGDPFDKAGAYAIQHPVFRPAARVEGCYANVMGLPVCDLIARLEDVGLSVADPVAACRAATGYPCSCPLDLAQADKLL